MRQNTVGRIEWRWGEDSLDKAPCQVAFIRILVWLHREWKPLAWARVSTIRRHDALLTREGDSDQLVQSSNLATGNATRSHTRIVKLTNPMCRTTFGKVLNALGDTRCLPLAIPEQNRALRAQSHFGTSSIY